MSRITKAQLQKTALAAGLGFVAGGIGMSAFLALGFDMVWEADRIAVGGVGVVYLMTGLFTLFGAWAPGVGAKVLNVADREELVELRTILIGSGVSVIALGVALLVLACSGDGGGVPDAIAVGVVALSALIIAVVSIRQWPLYDELWRQLSWESSAFGMSILLPVLMIWATAVHLGYLASMGPLTVIAVVAGSVLVGAFIAAGRRGLLAPR